MSGQAAPIASSQAPAEQAAPAGPRAPQSLAGRTAVVTGAGRGLGRAVARALAAEGARLALLGRSAPSLEEAAQEITAAGGVALPIVVDVTDEPQVERAAGTVAAELGGADVLVNNAGKALVRPLLETTTAEVSSLLALNVVGAMTCSRHFGRAMIARRWGRVINVASIAGLLGEANTAVYAASKGAVVAFTRALAVEWARHGVTVNAVAPGYFRTDLNAAALDDPDVGERLIKKIPLRRVGQPAELGPLFVYLASEASAFMTGSVLVIDGGQVAR
jgi:NAD(P)-dependent dehydrogenase (short-subunit alcohol dehydrogenase family)